MSQSTNLLTLEDEKFKTVKVHGYKFKIRYMSTKDKILVEQKRMLFQNGSKIEELTQEAFTLFQAIAMVDRCVEEFPPEFKEYQSSMDWDDEELVVELAEEIDKHTNEIKSKLKKNRSNLGSPKE